jgi:hypothetical protein
MIMAEQILVLMKKNDRVEEIIPYVEQVAQPGMRVIFLVPDAGIHNREASWWRDWRIAMEVEKQTRLATGLPAGYSWASKSSLARERHLPVCEYSWESQKRLYQETLFPLCAPLRNKGCEVSVALYMGSLRKAVRNYALNKDVYLIMVHPGVARWITRFFDRTAPTLNVFNRLGVSPVLLIQPGGSADR